jgi:RNA polymerase-binding protein DksA
VSKAASAKAAAPQAQVKKAAAPSKRSASTTKAAPGKKAAPVVAEAPAAPAAPESQAGAKPAGRATAKRAVKKGATKAASPVSDVRDDTTAGTTPATGPSEVTVTAAPDATARPARSAGEITTPTAATQAPPTAAQTADKGATMAKTADTKTTAASRKPAKGTRTAAETEKIRAALAARLDELRTEYDQTLSEITELQRERLTDSAGDDQADTGTKTFEREQEISLANSIRERITQVERALDRLDDGQYGWCERCGNAIPVERLAAFPSATLCVTCKQLEERR